MDLVTLAEAIGWICTRDREVMQEIAKDDVHNPLYVALQRFRRRQHWHRPRAKLGEFDDTTPRWVSTDEGKHASSQEALAGLNKAIFGRHMPLYVFGVEGRYRVVSDLELAKTELRLCERNRVSCGLWDRKLDQFIFVEPMVDLPDLQSLWPGVVLPRSIQVTKRILEALMNATQNGGRLKKVEAMELAGKVEGYGRRCFEEAWKQLPSDRKYGRGERGPTRKAA